MGKTILLTGAAGFIGFHTSLALLKRGERVIGLDNCNDYYEVSLKESRLAILKKHPNFKFIFQSVEEPIQCIEKIDKICHLAAQAGVRYSLEKPFIYNSSNMTGTLNVFEFARKNLIPQIVYASSSSVYGESPNTPFTEEQNVDKPISLYAATKKANELYSHVYSHLFGIKMTGLRFFTVYGPWYRPDMAIFKFIKAAYSNSPIDVYGEGKLKRDFTYIDDIVQGIIASLDKPFEFEVFNLGNEHPVSVNELIEEIEKSTGKKISKRFLPVQPGDVPITFASISKAKKYLGYHPKTTIKDGIKNVVDWYKEYYQV